MKCTYLAATVFMCCIKSHIYSIDFKFNPSSLTAAHASPKREINTYVEDERSKEEEIR